MTDGQLDVEGLVALHEVRAAKLRAKQLLFGPADGPKRQGAFGIKEVAVGPVDLGADPLPRAVADIAGDGVRWCRVQADVDVDDPAAVCGHHPNVGVSNERRRDQRAPEVIDFRALERIAALETGDDPHMICAERRRAAHLDSAEARKGPGSTGSRKLARWVW